MILLAAAAVIFVTHAWIYWDWTEDDAFISYRFARNLAAGEGLVFNAGERVEGYSNFTWVLLAAAGIRNGLDPIIWSKIVGLTAGVLSLLLSWLLARRMSPRIGLTALVAPCYIAIASPLVQHSVAGLETSFFALLVTAVILVASRRHLGSLGSFLLVLLLVMLSLTRPEGPAIAIVLLLLRAFVTNRAYHRDETAGQRTASRTFAFEFILYALLFGSYYIWRWSYFGAPFTNTYYAKTSGGIHGIIDGAQYTLNFLRYSGGVVFMGLALTPLFTGSTRSIYWMCLGVLVTYILFVIASGGDWMYNYRFYAHVLPVWASMLAVGIERLLELPRPGTTRAAWLSVVVGLLLLATFTSMGNTELRVARIVLPAVKSHNYFSQNYEELGIWFKDNTEPGAIIAISDVGAVGYFSERRILDMFGLIDPHIARLRGRMHYKTDPEYVLSRNPDYIALVSLNNGVEYSFPRIPDHRINALPEFHERYDLIRTVPQHWNNESVLVYRRKD